MNRLNNLGPSARPLNTKTKIDDLKEWSIDCKQNINMLSIIGNIQPVSKAEYSYPQQFQ